MNPESRVDLTEFDQKIQKYSFFRNITYYLFIALILINIITYYVFDYYLPLLYPTVSSYILYGFIVVGVVVQGYLYFLLRKNGKGNTFLKERGVIFGLILVLVIISFLFLDKH